MKNLILLFICGFLFGTSFLMNDKYTPVPKYTFQQSISSKSLSKSQKYALLMSAILPGTGEYYLGHKKRAKTFWTIEALSLGTWYYYSSEGKKLQDQYREYATEHWSMARWIKDYYKWKDTTIDSIFVKANGNYPEIWEDSHHFNFQWGNNENVVSSSTAEFETIFLDICGNDLYNCENYDVDVIEDLMNDENYKVFKDHNFYENIGKYDHFFAGWDDNDSLYVVVKNNGGELIAMSPHKKYYREIWTTSNEDYYLLAKYAISALMVNHVASMIDVLFLSKLSKFTHHKIESEPYFLTVNDVQLGGIKLKFYWD